MVGICDRQNYDNTYELALKEKDPIAFIDKRWGDPRPYFNEFIKPHIKPDSVVVEIGAGFGRYTRLAIPLCKKVYAIESSDLCLNFLREKFPDTTPLHCNFIDKIEDKIDTAFSMSTMLHFNLEEIHWYVEMLAKLMNPGGRFILHYMDYSEGLKKHTEKQLEDNPRYCFHGWIALMIIGLKTGLYLRDHTIPKNPIVDGHAIAILGKL